MADDPYVAELREMLLASVGGFAQFESSFNWRTFSPTKRAEQSLNDAVNTLEAAMAEIAETGIDPELQREWLSSAIKKWAAYQHAGARTINWMITGPARFPVERNNTAMRVEARRRDEYLEFVGRPSEWARRRQRRTDRKALVDADAASSVQHAEKSFGDVRVILNKALDRVQIIFPGKPADDERAALKFHAFRWAPSTGAWQRQLTQNGVWAAEAVMKKLGLEADHA